MKVVVGLESKLILTWEYFFNLPQFMVEQYFYCNRDRGGGRRMIKMIYFTN